MKLTPETLAELQAKNLPTMTAAEMGVESIGQTEQDKADAQAKIAELNAYLTAFLPIGEGKCIVCGTQQGGLLAAFTWGLAHGEGYCSSCGLSRARAALCRRLVSMRLYSPISPERINPKPKRDRTMSEKKETILQSLSIDLNPSYAPNPGQYSGSVCYVNGRGNEIKIQLDETVSQNLLAFLGPVLLQASAGLANQITASIGRSIEASKQYLIEANASQPVQVEAPAPAAEPADGEMSIEEQRRRHGPGFCPDEKWPAF